MTPPRMLGCGAAALLCAGATLSGQRYQVQIDPARAQIAYTLPSLIHTVEGTFQLKSAIIQLDTETGKASGLMAVDAASGQSGNDGRDMRMHKSILESAKFPEITFVPDAVEGKVNLEGGSSVLVHGTFGLHGLQHTITLPVQVHVGGGQMDLTTHFAIPYVEWGLKNPSTFLLRVDKTVVIHAHALGQVTPLP